MGIFNELSRDFNSGFNPAENLGQVLELMNRYTRIRTRTGAFNPIIYNSLHEKNEEKAMPKTISVDELEEEISKSTRPQAGYVDMENNIPQAGYMEMSNNTMQVPQQNNVMPTINAGQVERDTEDNMDM